MTAWLYTQAKQNNHLKTSDINYEEFSKCMMWGRWNLWQKRDDKYKKETYLNYVN